MFSLEMVRIEGLEPPRLAALEPKSSASANSATSARAVFIIITFISFVNAKLVNISKLNAVYCYLLPGS